METSTAEFILGLLTDQPRVLREVDWDSVLIQTETYRLGGLAWSVGPWDQRVPSGVLARWEGAYKTQALTNAMLLEELARLRTVFEAGGIPLGVVKGGQLLDAEVYPLGARSADDLDVVVPEASGPAAVQLLLDAGWEPWSEDVVGTMGWCDSATFHLSGQGKNLGLSVDLHWRTSYDRLRYGEAGAGTSHEWDQEGALRPEHHLVLTVEHFLKHLRYRTHLTALGDAVRLARRVKDWGSVDQALRRSSWGDAAIGLLTGLDATLDERFLPAAVRRRGSSRLVERLNPLGLILHAGAPKRRLGGLVLRWASTGPRALFTDLRDSVLPPLAWLEERYGSRASSSPSSLRMRHVSRVFRWGIGAAPSPLSPNQD